MKALRIGTRGSILATTQTGTVQRELKRRFPSVEFTIEKIQTTGDLTQDKPFSSMGSRSVFTRELDEALLNHKIDLAVHSLKDLTTETPKGVSISAVSESEDSRDAFISREGVLFHGLPSGAVVGTSSLRRVALVRTLRKDIAVKQLRGNVDSRLKKLRDTGEYDAIILAAAGLSRMGWVDQVTEFLDPAEFIPAPGQGRLAITCRSDDQMSKDVASVLNDPVGELLVEVERDFMQKLEGGCQVPLGCQGIAHGDRFHFSCFLGFPDGSQSIWKTTEGFLADRVALVSKLADEVLSESGREILDQLRTNPSAYLPWKN